MCSSLAMRAARCRSRLAAAAKRVLCTARAGLSADNVLTYAGGSVLAPVLTSSSDQPSAAWCRPAGTVATVVGNGKTQAVPLRHFFGSVAASKALRAAAQAPSARSITGAGRCMPLPFELSRPRAQQQRQQQCRTDGGVGVSPRNQQQRAPRCTAPVPSAASPPEELARCEAQ